MKKKYCYLCGKVIQGFGSTEKLFECHLKCRDILNEYEREMAIKKDQDNFKKAIKKKW